MMGMSRESCRHLLMTLQAGLIGIHLRTQLGVARPAIKRCLCRRQSDMHFVTGNAGKISAFETRRLLHAIKLASGDADHPVAPETIREEIRLGSTDEILLCAVVGLVRLNDK